MLLKDKKILISGLANKYSIASGIALAMHREAELAFTYQNERLLKNLKPIAENVTLIFCWNATLLTIIPLLLI